MQIQCTGTTDIITQNFYDWTNPVLFYLSLYQTLTVFLFYGMTKYYNQNSMYLKIADSVYYVKNMKTHRNFNFTKGLPVFLACLLYDHFFIWFIDDVRRRMERQSILSWCKEKSELFNQTIRMIEKGKHMMSDEFFFKLVEIQS